MSSVAPRRRNGYAWLVTRLLVAAVVVATGITVSRVDFIGEDLPDSFSVCEVDANNRPECEASDIRFEGAVAGQASDFGFSLASGFVNGDAYEDLVVGDPARDRVYVFYGRKGVSEAYGLDAQSLVRGVSAETQADVILVLDASLAGDVSSFGFSVAVGEERVENACAPEHPSSALVVGAPGTPGAAGGPSGAAFYLPPGALCHAPATPAAPTTVPVLSVGQAIRGPVPDAEDEFGYSVALGRVLVNTGAGEDVIVGARGAGAGAGRVVVCPVIDGRVTNDLDKIARIEGAAGDGLGEAVAAGDLDEDEDPDDQPFGGRDDLAIGAVGGDTGRVLLVQGPLEPAGGSGPGGIYREGEDPQIREILGERSQDFFGFAVAISAGGRLAVGAIHADNDPPGEGVADGGDERTNVEGGERINAGKAYLWSPGVFDLARSGLAATSARTVLVARRSGDRLGFALGFADLDASGDDELVVTATREDGSGLTVDEIDQGTAYVVLDTTFLSSPVDLGLCAPSSDCTGVGNVDVMIFGGERGEDRGDEMGFALAVGDFDGDGFPELFLSSRAHRRVYAVSLEDSDGDRESQGRNLRDADDDGDLDPDATDCAPLDPEIFSGAAEIPCNGIDENCNGMDDDAPDADADGFDSCGDEQTDPDCDDEDPSSYPGAEEACDGNDNACAGAVPFDERDFDGDGHVACAGWSDPQEDNQSILGGDDCDDLDVDAFPGAAEHEATPEACMRDADADGWGDASPPSRVTPGSDCDDDFALGATTYPGAAELDDAEACMSDRDGDGYGSANPAPGVAEGTDCDDADAATFPGAAERCDGNDNACAGTVPDDEADADGDAFVACAGWNDAQGDDPSILGGADCSPFDAFSFPGAAPLEAVPDACMSDADGDDYGDLTPPVGVTAGTDCDDASAGTFPGAAEAEAPLNCMKDDDGDGYGDATAQPPVVAGADCDDDDPTSFPGRGEVPDDGIDQDCNGTDAVTCFVDMDEDGFGGTQTVVAGDGDCIDPGESESDTDCDDGDADVRPGMEEIVGDGVDQDCDGADTVACFADLDRDGAGAAGTSVLAADGSCDADEQESANDDDCDDEDPLSFPGATERCDGNDNDCDGTVPEGEADVDGDTFVACTGWDDAQGDDPDVSGGGDCSESAADIHPGAAELEPLASACMKDRDGDGYGDQTPPAGVTRGTDCDDASAATFPGAAEVEAPLNCMRDEDDDGYGAKGVARPVVSGSDCDDQDGTTFPGAAELCDGNANACGGALPADELDTDGDGFVVCAGWVDTQGDDPSILGGSDCDDASAATFPGAAPRETLSTACMKDGDGDDFGDRTPRPGVTRGTDCDDQSATTFVGAAPLDSPLNCMRDDDGDDYGDATAALPVERGSDCDDDEPAVNRGVFEGPQGDAVCADGIDNDCDGSIDLEDAVCSGAGLCPDADEDGYADCSTDPSCDPGTATCGDCDDADPAVNPEAVEACDNLDNDCDGSLDEGFDQDGDSFTVCQLPQPDCDDENPAVNPAILERCADGVDNDCDAGTPDLFDADGDGATCEADCDDDDPALNLADADEDGYSTCSGDCDDADGTVSPGAPEACDDGVDNDCDASTPDVFDGDADGASCEVDCDDDDPALNLSDADGDNFSSCAGDCDDADPAVNPAGTELCDGIDNDCNGTVDDDFDDDLDGYTTCDQPTADCNDADPSINPGAAEVCDDGLDNDCNPATPDVGDADGDGVACDLDCDDADPASYPGAAELCDGNDNACAGTIPASELDADADGFVQCAPWLDTQGDDPAIAGGGDCDPSAADTFPGAAPNEVFATACMRDADGDGWGDLTASAPVVRGEDCDDASPVTFPGAAQIEAPLNCMRDADDDGWGDLAASYPVVRGEDCDDLDPTVYLGAPETPDDGIDQDCNLADTVSCVEDLDQDGYGTIEGTTVLAADGTCDIADQEASTADDCDDADPARYPGAPETCGDGVDSDCDGADPTCPTGDSVGDPERSTLRGPREPRSVAAADERETRLGRTAVRKSDAADGTVSTDRRRATAVGGSTGAADDAAPDATAARPSGRSPGGDGSAEDDRAPVPGGTILIVVPGVDGAPLALLSLGTPPAEPQP